MRASVGKAIAFIRTITGNEKLRTECYNCRSKGELYEKLGFNDADFEEAVNMQLVKCQTEEEAEYVREIKLWFAML